RSCGHRGDVEARQHRRFLAARPRGRGAPRRSRPFRIPGRRGGFRRGPVGPDGRRPGGRPGGDPFGGALRPLPLAPGGRVLGEVAVRDAIPVRGTCRGGSLTWEISCLITFSSRWTSPAIRRSCCPCCG